MANIDINGTSIHYERDGDGPPLLFVHGLAGHGDAWAEQAARFTPGHTCVRYDRRGHAGSALGDREVTHAVHSDDAVAVIEALTLAPCVLVASSLGAVIALDVARRRPDLVRGLVLSEPPLFQIDPAAGQAFTADLGPQVGAAIESGSASGFIDAFYAAVCPGLWSILDDDHRDAYRANGAIGMVDLQSPPLAITVEDLATITAPALVVSGDQSHPSLRQIAQRLAAGLVNARFVELEACGHVTYAEQPDQFAKAVEVFLAELDARAETGSVTMSEAIEAWHAEVAVEIAAPPEQVWAVVSDFSRHPALAGSGEVLGVRLHGPLAVGTTFDSDVRTGEVGSFSPRCEIEVVEAPRRLGWVSLFPLEEGETEDHQIEVHWTYDLEPTPTGTRLSHTVRIPPPKAGADELAAFFARTDRITTVRRGMERTLGNVKAAAEPPTPAQRPAT